MSEMDKDELDYTREHYTHEIRNKDLMSCNERELRIRCSFDERYIRILENKLKSLGKELDKVKKDYHIGDDKDDSR